MHSNHTRPGRQAGIALVTVLISISIITGLVSSLAYEQFVQSRRSGLMLHREQALMYLLAVEAYAKIVINLDSLQNGVDWYGPNEPWGRGIDNLFEGGKIKAAIIDLDGRFNLNNLRRIPTVEEINSGSQDINLKSIWHNCYLQIVTQAVGSTTTTDPQTMVESVEDWIDPDVEQREKGAEDAFYQSPTDLRGSYKPSNHLLGDVQELALLKGYETLFAEENSPTLLRHVSVLPTTTATININTATPEVLACLEPEGKLTSSIAKSIISARETAPFESVSNFTQMLNEQHPISRQVQQSNGTTTEKVPWETLIPTNYLDVRSQFALLRAELTFGVANITAYTLLQRTSDGAVRVLRRSVNPD